MQLLLDQVSQTLIAHQLKLATAESCTGGGIAAVLTDIAGSSAWFECGFITYSNAAKQQMLDVDAAILEQSGAVSEGVVKQMVQGALAKSSAQIAVAVSGIAGPSGGSETKPVGTVWLAWMARGQVPVARCYHFSGDRAAVRQQAVEQALAGVLAYIAE